MVRSVRGCRGSEGVCRISVGKSVGSSVYFLGVKDGFAMNRRGFLLGSVLGGLLGWLGLKASADLPTIEPVSGIDWPMLSPERLKGIAEGDIAGWCEAKDGTVMVFTANDGIFRR